MIQYHVSGSSGSGKSTLGERLADLGYTVVDIDHWVSAYLPITGRTSEDFERVINELIEEYHKEKTVYVIVGIAWTLPNRYGVPTRAHLIWPAETHKLFLTIPDNTLYCRYNLRVLKEIMGDFDLISSDCPPLGVGELLEKYLADLMTRKQCRDDYEKDLKYHCSRNYVPISSESAVDIIAGTPPLA